MVEETDLPGFVERLKTLIGDDSVSKFANEVGLGDNLVRKYLDGATPGLDKVLRICRAKGISVEWLTLGLGERLASEPGRPYRVGSGASLFGQGRELIASSDGREFVLLPRYQSKVGAGAGSPVQSDQIVDYLAFHRAWFERHVGIPAQWALLVEVHGDSNEPDMEDGDLLIVDTRRSDYAPDTFYVLLIGDALRVKKVRRRDDGALEIRSSNPRYGLEVLASEQAEAVIVLGSAKRRISDRRLP